MGEIFLRTKGITKRFGETIAVNNVEFSIETGKIQGLIGENGSGKSTICSMICGICPATSGSIILRGENYAPKDPGDARSRGIGMIVQELGTIDYLTVAENIFLGEENRFGRFGVINKAAMNAEAEKALEAVDLSIDVTVPAISYDFETRKLIETAKVLYYSPELLIVDETTTALSQSGREKIHGIMREFAASDKAVLFISHDLPELMETCDNLTVLRDGELVAVIERSEYGEDYIKQTMVGRKLEGSYYRSDYDPSCGKDVAVRVEGLCTGQLHDVCFDVRKGEIVGIGGLSDSGMHEVGRALFGMAKAVRGTVKAYAPAQPTRAEKFKRNKARLKLSLGYTAARIAKLFGKQAKLPVAQEDEPLPETEYVIRDISDALKAGIGYVSKDRDRETLILQASVKDNLCLSAMDLNSVFGFVSPQAERRFAETYRKELSIKCSSVNQDVRELSGGNKQKVSFGKWIGNKSNILVFDSPTRGVDVGVKTTMYRLLYDLKKRGYAIVVISEEMQELIGMSDRILIVNGGKISGEFIRSENLRDTDIIGCML